MTTPNNTLATLVACVQKPDSYRFGHIILHAAAVAVPFALAHWHPIAPAISVALWGIVILIIGGHGNGKLPALMIALGFGALVAIVALFGPFAAGLGAFASAAAFSWLVERIQNGGEWCGEDVAGFHSRIKGAGVGLGIVLAALAVMSIT